MMQEDYCLEHTCRRGHAKQSEAGLALLRQALLMDCSQEGFGV